MAPLLTVTGRDVLFAHWPVDRESLRPLVPDPLAIETFDDAAWVSALALENRSVTPGSLALPSGPGGGFAQLNLRTYVTVDGESGVYFLSLDSDSHAAAAVGRRLFGLPFHAARVRLRRRGGAVTFASRRDDDRDATAVFQARYRPHGSPYRAAPGSLEDACIEHRRYYLSVDEDRRIPGVSPVEADRDLHVGTIDRDPWQLRPVSATLRRESLLAAAGLSAPGADPVFHYSPGFAMCVEESG